MGGHEHEAIVVRIGNGKFDVGSATGRKSFARILNARQVPERFRETTEILMTYFTEERLLVVEVEIDSGWRVFDALGDLSHSHTLVSVSDEQFARGVENLLSN